MEGIMKIIILTNDNYFSFKVLRDFLKEYRSSIKLIIFSSALIGKRNTFQTILWSLRNTGLRHTIYKTSVYGIFKAMKLICTACPFIKNKYSSNLWAKQNNINYIHSPKINEQPVVDKIKSINPDLIISVSMNQIVKKSILDIPKYGCINIHCAPLPKYQGMSPYVWALANGENASAATIHYMTEGLDEGDIIVQEFVPVIKNDSAFFLFLRCCIKASNLLLDTVKSITEGNVSSYKQDLSKKSYFSWPDKEAIKNLKTHGYSLMTFRDILFAIFRDKPRC